MAFFCRSAQKRVKTVANGSIRFIRPLLRSSAAWDPSSALHIRHVEPSIFFFRKHAKHGKRKGGRYPKFEAFLGSLSPKSSNIFLKMDRKGGRSEGEVNWGENKDESRDREVLGE